MSDSLDRKLIKSLKKNSRRSLIELSDELYVPESTIRYRINSLIKKGIIIMVQYIIIIIICNNNPIVNMSKY